MKGGLRLAGLAMALLTLASGTRAAPPPSGAIDLPLDTDVIGPSLANIPSNDDLQREYPRAAWLMGLGGNATMTCKALTDGRLDDCHVVSENPEGIGFGAATVRVAIYFRTKPAMRNGRPVEGTITIPIHWQMADGGEVAVAAPLAPATPAALVLARRAVELEGVAGRLKTDWQATLEQQTAQLMTDGDPQTAQDMIDALQQGLTEAAQEEAERQAHELGAHMSEADLRATVAFLETPAGAAWLAAQSQSYADRPKTFYQRVATLARSHYCPPPGCAGVKPASATSGAPPPSPARKTPARPGS